ncbi:putative deacetylase [Saccharomonospora marina XMU15]|uniref:Putative deacetylase n=1 Tax=Saccharomonospora marina XMU15 TaxID=882083 RepID=H5XA37_9PSEU|nr:DUF2334 domain-containing protein [Saccharomonospora marina]EHR53697.1 putative deacetylase [Saccharomonospora marina XMU15]
MAASLLVSLSGIAARTLDGCVDLATALAERGVPLSLLVTPNAEEGSGSVSDWVRERVAQGDAVLLHGYDRRVRDEFADLPTHEARLRLIAATAALEDTGLRTNAFAAPGRRVSAGTLNALRLHGFAVYSDGSAVHDLRGNRIRRARLHGFGGRGGAGEAARRNAFVLAAGRLARRGELLRIGVRGADLGRPARWATLLDAVDTALECGAVAATYVRPAHTSTCSPRGSTLTSVPSPARLVNRP